jgi:hypothetical protein
MGYWEEQYKRNKRIDKDYEKSGVYKASGKQVAGGALFGGSILLSRINKGRMFATKPSLAMMAAGVGLSTVGTINAFRASKKLGKEAESEYSPALASIANPILGAYVGVAAGMLGIMGANKLAKFSRAAKVARDAKKASVIKKTIGGSITPEVMSKGKMVWRRIRGRIIPMKVKNV